MSINWPDACFLQMIEGGAFKCWILTFCFVIKKSERIQWQNRSFHMLISKLNLMITQIMQHHTKWTVYFVKLQIMLKTPSKAKLVKYPYPKTFKAISI